MNIHKIYGLFLPHFRRKRMRRFLAVHPLTPATTVLDVGGYPWCWPADLCPGRFTLLNIEFPPGLEVDERFTLTKGDGCRLPFADGSFELGYSNSVIEHLSTYENQKRFAAEIRRVGRRLWVQTPARWFFIEPHLISPFVHYLPKSWQRHLLRWFTIWGLVTKPTPKQVEDFLNEVRLLTYREMQELFPDCRIVRERFCGLTKCFVAVR